MAFSRSKFMMFFVSIFQVHNFRSLLEPLHQGGYNVCPNYMVGEKNKKKIMFSPAKHTFLYIKRGSGPYVGSETLAKEKKITDAVMYILSKTRKLVATRINPRTASKWHKAF